MAQILIRDLDPRDVAKLKEQAAANGRSLESEVRILLEREAMLEELCLKDEIKQPARPRKASGRSRRK